MWEIKARSDCLTLRVAALSNLSDLNGSESEMLLKCASQELHAIEMCLAGARIFDCAKPISIEEHCHLANLSYRFAKLCYQKCAYKQVLLFLDLTIQQFSLWAKEASSRQLEKQLVARKLEISISSLRKLKKYDTALNTVVDTLLVDPSYLHAADMWVKIQEDSSRSEDPPSDYRILHDSVKAKSEAADNKFLHGVIYI